MNKLTEPHDVIFENLYYSKFMGFLRTIACYLIGLPLAFGITYLLFKLEESSEPEECGKEENHSVSSLLWAIANYIIIQILFYLMEKVYEITHHLFDPH